MFKKVLKVAGVIVGIVGTAVLALIGIVVISDTDDYGLYD